MNKKYKIALIGNPNCGKTTIFNNITGARQKVGNWPGVTVEKKTGSYSFQGHEITITDLPGIYSLSPAPQNNSIDQQISNKFIQDNQVDLYVNILDSTNLKRNLYLSLQLIALGLPCLIVMNMTDKLKLQKLAIDNNKLSNILNHNVIAISSTQNSKHNTQLLKQAINQSITKLNSSSTPSNITQESNLAANLGLNIQTNSLYNNLNELVLDVTNKLKGSANYSFGKILQLLETEDSHLPSEVITAKHDLNHLYDEDADIIVADLRYQLINDIYAKVIISHETSQDDQRTNNKINRLRNNINLDSLVLNNYLGIPIFLFILYGIFEVSISLGEVLKPFFELSSSFLADNICKNIFSLLNINNHFTETLSQGLYIGVTTVAGFIPQIALMFILLTFLEDSGYMARAAFVMDRLMQSAGLPGKSFVPLIISFGCNVPAILSTRTLDNTRDRILTCIMSPFMSCSARLAIFIVFASAFFPENQGAMVFLLYLTGIFIAIITGLLLKSTILSGKPAPFILELPSYNIPTIKNITIATTQRCKGFIIRAGKLIIPICIGLQLLNNIQFNGNWVSDNKLESSALAQTGKLITPVLSPIGISNDNWPATVGLITGSLAKEVVVGTLNTLYSTNLTNTESSAKFALINTSPSFMVELTSTFNEAKTKSYALLLNLFSSEHYNIAHKQVDNDEFSSIAFNQLSNAFPSVWAAFAYCLFVLLYMPCLSTFSILMKEIGKNWAIASLIWSLDIAYTTAAFVYQLSNITETPVLSLTIISLLTLWHVLLYKFLKSGKLEKYFITHTYDHLNAT